MYGLGQNLIVTKKSMNGKKRSNYKEYIKVDLKLTESDKIKLILHSLLSQSYIFGILL